MAEDRKKVAIVGGILAGIGVLILAGTRVKAAPPPPGRANLYGKVTDGITGKTIPGVLVTLNDLETLTDSAGNYILDDIEPGAYALTFEKEGYETTVFMADIVLVEGNNELNGEMIPLGLAVGWISPTSHIDPDGQWHNPERAYDGNPLTEAQTWKLGPSWLSYLVLLVNETYTNKVRFYASYYPDLINKIDVDVYYEGAWHDIYEGVYPDREWVEKAIPAGTKLVSKAKVRFYNAREAVVSAFFSEFQFGYVGEGG